MRLIGTLATCGLRVRLLSLMIAGPGAMSALSYPALAQESAPAGSGEAGAVSPARSPAGRDIAPALPQPGSLGLWRRASVKTLIANPPRLGLPSANARITPSPLRPGIAGSVSRNTVGAALPAARSDGGKVGIAIQAGADAGGQAMRQKIPVLPANGPTPHGAAINGTTMGRIASGSGSIGGPATDHSGINGTLMRRKR